MENSMGNIHTVHRLRKEQKKAAWIPDPQISRMNMKSGRRGWGEGKVGVGKRERVVDWQRSLAEELFYGLKKFGFNNRG